MEQDAKQVYGLLSSSLYCPVFMQPWWLDVTCGAHAWTAIFSKDEQGQVSAGMPYHFGSELGFWHWAKMPHLTPYTGVLINHPQNMTSATARQSFTLAQWRAISTQLPKGYCNLTLHPTLSPSLPWNQLGLRSEPRVTYSLALDQDIDAIWEGMQSRARGAVRKAKKQLHIETSEDAGELYRMLEMSFGRQRLKVPISQSFIADLVSAIVMHDAGLLTKAIDEQGRVHACNLVVKDDRCAYNLLTGSDHTLHQSGAVSLLIWHAIETMHGRVRQYDFEGGMMTGIASFYASFGALRSPYTRIFRSSNRITDACLTLMGRF